MDQKKLKAQCNKCLGETNHILLHQEDQNWEEWITRDQSIYGCNTFRMVKCCGCDSIKLMHQDWMSEICDDDGNPIQSVNYYPPAISKAKPKWLSNFLSPFEPKELNFIGELFGEIYSALHNDSRRLAVMGIRALIEHLMIKEIGDQGSFKKNLDSFQSAGFLSGKQKGMIEPILEAGHAAMHRGYDPNPEDVLTVVEITESLVETIYIHSTKADRLNKNVPKREKKK